MPRLASFRAEKDELFRSHHESPLTPEQRETFRGLRYYPENPALVFDIEPDMFAEPEQVRMLTSTGDEQLFVRWALLKFKIDGTAVQLTLFGDPGGGYFLPFTDAGRGTETYGAGRYLEPEDLAPGLIHVDFNFAYNPYCAYNDAWSCPLPPPENHLPVHIRAGELAFEQ